MFNVLLLWDSCMSLHTWQKWLPTWLCFICREHEVWIIKCSWLACWHTVDKLYIQQMEQLPEKCELQYSREKFKREKCLFNFQMSPSHKPLSHLPKTHLYLLTSGFVCIIRIYSLCDPAVVTDICRLRVVVNCDVNVTPGEKKILHLRWV